MSRRPTLDTAARRAVLTSLKTDGSKLPAPSVHASFSAPRFEDIDEYLLIKAQREFAATVGIENPYYRPWEAAPNGRLHQNGRNCVNFGCYDYLGLQGHPEIIAAAAAAAERWGVGAGASRLTAGERPPHRALEKDLADFHGSQDALVFVSGHATNVSVIAALLRPGDLVLHDALAHNSIVFGAVASGAERRSFPHNDCEALECLLAQTRPGRRRVLIATEGLFSMDGDSPDLARLIEIKSRYGAWLMLDEAHSVGVLGPTGRGLIEAQGVRPGDIDILMGTLSKTFVSCGGYVTGSTALVDILRYQASGMVYSVGLSPVLAASARAALGLLRREPERVKRLANLSDRFATRAQAEGLATGGVTAAVQPVIVGDSLTTLLLADRLLQRGIVAVPIIPPGVPANTARLRFFLSCLHEEAEIDDAVAATAKELAAVAASGSTLEAFVAVREGGEV